MRLPQRGTAPKNLIAFLSPCVLLHKGVLRALCALCGWKSRRMTTVAFEENRKEREGREDRKEHAVVFAVCVLIG